MATLKKISTNLWFNTEAEDAAKFYTSIFKNSKFGKVSLYPNVGQEIHKKKAGSVMTVEFEIEGQSFIALNGGPDFKFNESISFVINCDTQEEIDFYWEKLGKGGDPKSQQCGWLKDKFGVSWQVVPERLNELIVDKDKEKVERVFSAMLKMKKLEIEKFEAAANEMV